MPSSLPISTYVDIATAIAAGGVLRTDFGTGLLITTDPALPAGGDLKSQVFRDRQQAAGLLDAGSALSAATVWFSREGARSLNIGRWAETAVATTLDGSTPGSITALAITNAAFVVDGAEVTVDLNSAATYAALAAAIEAGIANGALTGRLLRVNVSDGGQNYVAATTTAAFAAAPPGGTDATGDVVVDSTGEVTGVNITDAGEGYLVAPSVTISDSGAGTGALATSALQNAGATANLTGARFDYINGAFVLSVVQPVDIGGFLEAPSSGTDISDLLGMGVNSTPDYKQGHSQESITDAADEMIALAGEGGAPVALMLDGTVLESTTMTADGMDVQTAMAAYAQAGDFVYGLLDVSDQAVVTGDDTSLSSLAFQRQQDKVEPLYSMPGERPDVGLLALMSSQNLDQPASIITPHLKSLPGVLPTNITETQRRELERKRTNVYTTVGGLPSLVGGFTGRAGSWLDAVWWLLWLKNKMKLNIFNAQRASRRFNTAILADVLQQVMAGAVNNRGIMPGGRVNASVKQDIITTTGNYEFDGILASGYLIWVERPAVRSDLDRENRIGRFKVWMAPSDAIHKVYGDLVLSG